MMIGRCDGWLLWWLVVLVGIVVGGHDELSSW